MLKNRSKASKRKAEEVPERDLSEEKSETDEEVDSGYKVDSIVGVKRKKGKKLYRVRWVGFPPDTDTWEPAKNLVGYDKMIKAYELAKKSAKKNTSMENVSDADTIPDKTDGDHVKLRGAKQAVGSSSQSTSSTKKSRKRRDNYYYLVSTDDEEADTLTDSARFFRDLDAGKVDLSIEKNDSYTTLKSTRGGRRVQQRSAAADAARRISSIAQAPAADSGISPGGKASNSKTSVAVDEGAVKSTTTKKNQRQRLASTTAAAANLRKKNMPQPSSSSSSSDRSEDDDNDSDESEETLLHKMLKKEWPEEAAAGISDDSVVDKNDKDEDAEPESLAQLQMAHIEESIETVISATPGYLEELRAGCRQTKRKHVRVNFPAGKPDEHQEATQATDGDVKNSNIQAGAGTADSDVVSQSTDENQSGAESSSTEPMTVRNSGNRKKVGNKNNKKTVGKKKAKSKRKSDVASVDDINETSGLCLSDTDDEFTEPNLVIADCESSPESSPVRRKPPKKPDGDDSKRRRGRPRKRVHNAVSDEEPQETSDVEASSNIDVTDVVASGRQDNAEGTIESVEAIGLELKTDNKCEEDVDEGVDVVFNIPVVDLPEYNENEMISKFDDLNARYSTNDDLRRVVTENNLDQVELLLRTCKHLDVNQPDTNTGETLVMLAVLKGYNAVLELLLLNGANVNSKRITDDVTALLLAANLGNQCAVNMLLLAGAQVNAQERITLETPLIKAVKKGHRGVVLSLLDQAANVSLGSATDKTALACAKLCKCQPIIDLLTIHRNRLALALLQQVEIELDNSGSKIGSPVFALQCFRLRDGNKFITDFNYELEPTTATTGILLFIGHGHISLNQADCRLSGESFVTRVQLNDGQLKSVAKVGNFILPLNPLNDGHNQLVISTVPPSKQTHEDLGSAMHVAKFNDTARSQVVKRKT